MLQSLNFGATASRRFLNTLSLPVGEETRRRGKKRDHSRTVKAEAAVTEKAKKHRQVKAEARQREEQRLLDTYGQFYLPGGGGGVIRGISTFGLFLYFFLLGGWVRKCGSIFFLLVLEYSPFIQKTHNTLKFHNIYGFVHKKCTLFHFLACKFFFCVFLKM